MDTLRYTLVLALLLSAAPIGCRSSMGSAIDRANPFVTEEEQRNECLARNDVWMCRDPDTREVCRTSTGASCQSEAHCPDCNCVCLDAPE